MGKYAVSVSATQLNNEKTSYALRFWKRTFQPFASKTIQNHSKGVEKFQHFDFVQPMYFLNRFIVRMLANIQQRLNS